MVINNQLVDMLKTVISKISPCKLCFYNIEGKEIENSQDERVYYEVLDCIRSKRIITITNELYQCKKGVKEGILFSIEIHNSAIGAVSIHHPNIEYKEALLIKVYIEKELLSYYIIQNEQFTIQINENLIYHLYTGNNPKEAKRLAILLGINIEAKFDCIVGELSSIYPIDLSAEERRSIVFRLFKLSYSGKQPLCSFIDSKTFVLYIPSENVRRTDERHKNDLHLYCKELDDVIFSKYKIHCKFGVCINNFNRSITTDVLFKQASYAVKCTSQMELCSFVDELGIDCLLQNLPDELEKTFCYNILDIATEKKIGNEIIVSGLDDILINTLFVFFENNLNLSKTSQSLFLHRNTLNYRVDKIKLITDKDPRVFKDAMELYLAIQIRYKKNKNLIINKERII